MRIILLAGGPRSGLDLFHSLLDNHSEILQFPGILYIDQKLKKILSQSSKKKIAKEFIKEYKNFFDSRKLKIERHHQLGEKKNKFYEVDKEKFVENFLSLSKKKKFFNNQIFQNLFLLHKAYDSKDLGKKKKIILINAHILPFVLNFEKIFKGINYEIIHTIRHPLSAISSTVKNWINYKNGIYLKPKELFYNLDLIVFGIQKLKNLKRKIHIIQLENLHQKANSIMKKFCKIYGLKFEKTLLKSTFHNLKWWGDAVSGKDLNGLNKNFKASYDLDLFEESDLGYLKYILNDILKKYNYKINIEKKMAFHFKPLKCERISWKKTIENKQIKHSISILFFYLKRVLKFNIFFIKKEIFLPKSIS